MRFIFLSIALSLSNPLFAGPVQNSLALKDVLTDREFRSYQQNPAYKSRMELFKRALDRYSGQVTSLVKQRNLKDTLDTLRKIQLLAEVGLGETDQATNRKDFRSKQVKRLEIRLRKLVETLGELKMAVPFESRTHFERTVDLLEQFREGLLKQLFGPSLSSDIAPVTPSPMDRLDALTSVVWRAGSTYSAQSRHATISGDQFTDLEYNQIQDAQELAKRVKVFLEIAESRLIEIERRQSGLEWDKEEANPLEYFTYAQMVHAYDKAIEGIMINIDEKAKYRTAEKKEIRKSLKMLNKKIQEFLPRLEPILQLSIERKDEELYREYRKAKKSSETARKGSQMGLGAPVGK